MFSIFKGQHSDAKTVIERLREELETTRKERDRLAADLRRIYDITRETRPAWVGWVEKEF